MQSTQRFARLALLLGLAAGCGTQIGNPTGAGMIRLTDNSRALNTLLNASFLQTIDGMNIGDYGYARQESRVSDRSCQTQAGSKLSLIDKTETKHSVIDESDEWYAKSDLTIKRSYQDAWTQNNVLLACNPKTNSINFDYNKLSTSSLKLESQVDEDINRVLFMTEKKLEQELRHNLVMKKTGKRSLELVGYTEDNKQLVLEAQLRNQLDSTVNLDLNEEGATEAKLQLLDRFTLDFSIHLDKARDWTRYEISQGRQEFLIPESGEILRLEFKNIVFTKASACVPESGLLTATVVRPNLPNVRYSLNFQPDTPLILKREGGTDSLVLAPFACVLKER
jgi:hypothetical protein